LLLEFPKGAYDSLRGTERFALSHVSSDPDDFGFDFSSGTVRSYSSTVYDDLGYGSALGSRDYSEADEATTTVINITADGVSYINSARGGTFAMGGKMSSMPRPVGKGTADWLFLNTGLAETDFRYTDAATLRALRLYFYPTVSAPMATLGASATALPEPVTLGMLAVASLMLRRRRR
jgi:hypothetical protein